MALAIACQLIGCATAGRLWWPRHQRTHTFTRTVQVDVATYPAGASIEVDGKPVDGAAPTTVDATHTVRRTYYEESYAGLYLGCAAEIGAFAYLAVGYDDAQGDSFTGPGLALGFVLVDCLGWAYLKNWDNLKRGAKEQVVTSPVVITAHWPDSPSAQASLVVPTDRAVTLTQVPATTFDAALARWIGATDREPEPAALYRAGIEQLALARATHRADHRARAEALLRRYLASSDVPAERRREVEADLAGLEATP